MCSERPLVDIHSHWYSRLYFELLKARSDPPCIVGDEGAERLVIFEGEEGRLISASYWSLTEKLRYMERWGITQTVLSLGNPWLDPFNGADAPELAQQLNSELGSLEEQTGGRIVGLGVLPHSSLRDALTVLEEIEAHRALYGAISGTVLCGRPLDDPDLDPLWGHLNDTGTPFMIHPHYTAAADRLTGFGHALPVTLGFTFETTIAVSRMIFAGILERFPRLRLVVVHGGGALAFLAGRLDAAWRSDPSTHRRLTVPPSSSMSRLFADSLVNHERSIAAIVDMLGVDHLAFGSDHPFSISDPKANVDALEVALDGVARDRVRFGSARDLFGLPLVCETRPQNPD